MVYRRKPQASDDAKPVTTKAPGLEKSPAPAPASRPDWTIRHLPPAPSPAVKAAGEAIHRARMTGVELQPRTVLARRAVPVEIDFLAIKVDRRGETHTEVSKIEALLSEGKNPVWRLMRARMIAPSGGLAACLFAWAGDRVLSPFRVRTVRFDRIIPGEAALNDKERDELARQRWAVATQRLSRRAFRILDGVMRHDETVETAARAAYPEYRDRGRIIGMGDQALMESCAVLAEEYGLENRKSAERALEGS